MPRIITSETTDATVANLQATAKRNMRSAGKEALVAIEAHILNEAIKAPAKRRKSK